MPPKKKCTHKARKAELVFLERPWAGPVHCYETPLPLAENPRHVPTKPVDRNTSTAWVCPQFETTKSVVLKACQKKHRGPHRSQNQDTNHSLLHAGGACQRPIACKFPPLTFVNAERHAAHPLDHPNHSKTYSQTTANVNIKVKTPEACRKPAAQPVEQEVVSPPDAQDAQVLSPKNWICSNTLHPEKEQAFPIDPCVRGESAAVLVTDTPEHEYGVKVTWRRRPHIMKYLQQRG
ncbi:RHNO1 protein, partial [Smithornis capensis]|nr:RHNO1 protein [Smithornis capensis]